MFDGFYTTPPVYENIYRAVYDLKGRFDGPAGLPHWGERPGKGDLCLGPGDLRGATLLVGGSPWVGRVDHPAAFPVLRGPSAGPGARGRVGGDRHHQSLGKPFPGDWCPASTPTGCRLHWAKDQPPPKPPRLPLAGQRQRVDLNHNFDAGWELLHKMERQEGYIGPGPTATAENRPHSEPETRAIAGFCLAAILGGYTPSTPRGRRSTTSMGRIPPTVPV